ncbi:MAG TPA: type I-E CRISPR-associated endoribonuclease Cas2e [Bacillota bacterium]|jgi:CRISPR-associated protein Cas2|nr:type I-E CRISPR-associated endoribonuclease Cas2e [Bacillota bacterium]HPZ14240.1 type I-E CRISPR-associated endoribonuclease Cas2e [Bacillota bacterium]HQD79732.1 type I-E CRISPR-associated endoribonuclease Cas2e [Bacillota bacterium]
MSMTVVVTRNVPDRIRGFLASSMLEVGPGVYTGSNLSVAVRDRIWGVLEDWFPGTDGSIVMVWEDKKMPGGQSVKVLGIPPIDLVEVDGIILARREMPPKKQEDD